MQEELKAIQRRLGITFVFVTHDQGEALSMADRVAVFDRGRIAQVGSPQEIYERPRTRFVADFVGSSNVLGPPLAARFGASGWASLRPEAIRLDAGGPVAGTATASRYLGAGTQLTVAVDGAPLAVYLPAGVPVPEPGASVRLGWTEGAVQPLAE